MNPNAVKLLQAAAEFLGSDKQLAEHLGIAPSLLGKLLSGLHPVPDPLLLLAVDILLAHRQSLDPLADTRASGLGGGTATSGVDSTKCK